MAAEESVKATRKPNLIEALSTVVFLLALVFIGVQYAVNTVAMMILATVWVMIIGWRCGYSYSDMWESIMERLGGLMEVVLIILAIGVFVAAMMFSGAIPAIIYYLVGIIDPNFIVVLSFVIPAIVSVLIGTSWGTAGTVGIVMVSIATSMGANMPLVAGAVISGTHVGQLLSPMADTTNVGANLAETDTMTMIKRVAIYAVPVAAISTVAYLVLGLFSGGTGASMETRAMIQAEIAQVFNVNPLVILPMVLVFALTFMKKPIVFSLIVSSIVALVFGTFFNGWMITDGLEALYSGFALNTITGLDEGSFSEIFITLVNRGGIMSQIGSALLAIVATCYGAVMIQIGAVDVIANAIFSRVKGRVGLVISAALTSFMVVALTTSAYLAVLMSSDLFKHKFHDKGMDDLDVLSSCMSASTQSVILVPWVDTAIFMAGVTGVPTLASLPFTFFGWGNMVMAVILAIFGIGFANGTRKLGAAKAEQAAE